MDAKEELFCQLVSIVKDASALRDVLNTYRITKLCGDSSNSDYLIDVFLNCKKIDGASPSTLEHYEGVLRLFLKHVRLDFNDVTTDDIRLYVGSLSAKGLKDSSIQAHIAVLRNFFNWMYNEGRIKQNPMNKIKSLKIDRKQARHSLSPEEIERIRDACKTYKEKALVEFLVSSGCRLSECISILVKDVDWINRSVQVVGKGKKRRTVYFSVRAKLMLEAYLKERRGGIYLFSSSRSPYGQLSESGVQCEVRKIGDRSGLPVRIHPHIFRHTFATSALNSGMDIAVIQALLGHEDLSTTQIYAEMSQSTVRYQYERFVA